MDEIIEEQTIQIGQEQQSTRNQENIDQDNQDDRFYVRHKAPLNFLGETLRRKQTPRKRDRQKQTQKRGIFSTFVANHRPHRSDVNRIPCSEPVHTIRDYNLPVINLPFVDKTHESIVVDLNPNNYDSRNSNIDSALGRDSAISNDLPTDQLEKPGSTPEPDVSQSPVPMTNIRSPIRKPYEQILSGVIFTISGLINPKRALLKDLASDMGATYRRTWDNSCTHLICGYKLTPLFKLALGRARIVREHWIVQCHEEQQLIDWRIYKLDKLPFEETDDEHNESDSNADTDDSSIFPGLTNETFTGGMGPSRVIVELID